MIVWYSASILEFYSCSMIIWYSASILEFPSHTPYGSRLGQTPTGQLLQICIEDLVLDSGLYGLHIRDEEGSVFSYEKSLRKESISIYQLAFNVEAQ